MSHLNSSEDIIAKLVTGGRTSLQILGGNAHRYILVGGILVKVNNLYLTKIKRVDPAVSTKQ